MNRSSGLQLVGLMLAWVGLRFLLDARAGADGDGGTILVISALAVGASALFAAVAVFRASTHAPRVVTLWAVLLFGDVVLQQLLTGTAALAEPMMLAVLAGVAFVLAALVMHVRHYTGATR